LLRAGIGAGGITAAPRGEQIHIPLDDSFPSEFWTDQCGLPVTISNTGDLHVTLVRNSDGLVVRETDRTGGMKVTFSSANGSFSFPSAPSHWDYGDGAELGSTVVVSFTGLQSSRASTSSASRWSSSPMAS